MLNPELYTGSSSLVLNILSLPKHSCIIDNSKSNSSVEVLNTKSFEVVSLLLLQYNVFNTSAFIEVFRAYCYKLKFLHLMALCSSIMDLFSTAEKKELGLVSISSPAEEDVRRWHDHK